MHYSINVSGYSFNRLFLQSDPCQIWISTNDGSNLIGLNFNQIINTTSNLFEKAVKATRKTFPFSEDYSIQTFRRGIVDL
jgi:hypothetical protein